MMCMAKVRIYELAKELNVSSKAMVNFLVDLGRMKPYEHHW